MASAAEYAGAAHAGEEQQEVDYGEYGAAVGGDDVAMAGMDPELADLQNLMQQMEEETATLVDTTSKVAADAAATLTAKADLEAAAAERDQRSVFVGNVDFSATAEEVGKHFETCGPVERVTLVVDKHTGHPKGFAYVEFMRKDSADNGLVLNGSEFKGRALKVIPKRTNVPSWQLRGRGRGRGRGAPRGGFYAPRGGFRGAGRGYFAPRGAPYSRGRGRGRGYY